MASTTVGSVWRVSLSSERIFIGQPALLVLTRFFVSSQTLNSTDYDRYFYEYINCPIQHYGCLLGHLFDFTKPFVEIAHPLSRLWRPQWSATLLRSTACVGNAVAHVV